jgi:hypothetical protein
MLERLCDGNLVADSGKDRALNFRYSFVHSSALGSPLPE